MAKNNEHMLTSAPTRRQWSLPRRLMSFGFTGLNRTTSNIESKNQMTRNNAMEERDIKYISGLEYESIKDELLGDYGFTFDQLIELQGLSVASAILKTYPKVLNNVKTNKILICCGNGIIGKSGLVSARHLKLFGYRPTIYTPQPGRSHSYNRLIKQCQEYEIPFLPYLPHESRLISESFNLILDVMDSNMLAINTTQLNDTLMTQLAEVANSGIPIISVDVPLGWDVNEGPPKGNKPIILPDCLVSLIAPKKCAQNFKGHVHWLGGRFMLPTLAIKYELNLPEYRGSEQIVDISNTNN